jgi:hypothetical protein
MSKPAYTSLDSFRQFFYRVNLPWWNLYNGHSKNLTDLCFKQLDELSIDDSWKLLCQMITDKTNPMGGKLSVYIPDRARSSQGIWEYLDIPGIANQMSTYASSIGNPGSVQQMIADALEKDRMQRRIEELEKGKSESIGTIDKVIDKFCENLPVDQLTVMLASKFLGTAPAQTVNRPSASKTVQPKQLNADEQERLRKAVYELSKYFPNDFVEILEGLCDLLEQRPDMIEMVNNLVKPQEASGVSESS